MRGQVEIASGNDGGAALVQEALRERRRVVEAANPWEHHGAVAGQDRLEVRTVADEVVYEWAIARKNRRRARLELIELDECECSQLLRGGTIQSRRSRRARGGCGTATAGEAVTSRRAGSRVRTTWSGCSS